MDDCIYRVAREIMGKMGELTGVKVYVSITNNHGKFIYSDSAFKNYEDFIRDFVQANFKYLQQGDHSIPLSSQNIVFFKSADNAMIILYNPKGKIGQLLTFKSMLSKYTGSIEECTLKIKSTPLELVNNTSVIQKIPSIEIKIPVITHKENLYKNIKPTITKKITNEKFSLIESKILRMCDGDFSLFDIMKNTKLKDNEINDILYGFLTKKIIRFPNHELIKIPCHDCKNLVYLLIPKFILDKTKNSVRIQLFPEECNHSFLAFIDKKLGVKTSFINNLLDFKNELDLSNLSMKNLISFFGHDLFSNIFHAIFFRIPVVFIGEEEFVKELTQFLKKIFVMLEFGVHFFCVNKIEFEKNSKEFKNYLIIDLDSNLSINPYEEQEPFDFEFKLFKNILKIEDDNLQILKTNSEFERLILLTENILKEIVSFMEISEDNLIKSMKAVYNVEIERYEIPIIIKLAEIYYNTDVSKKIKRTVSGQLSTWFDDW
jgi:hypothetical protein